MPRYSYGGGPAEYAQFQQSRRDDQIRNILNMMMQMKQYQTGREDELFNRGIEERRTAAYEQNAQPNPPQISEWQYKLMHPELFPQPLTTEQEIAKAAAMAEASATGRARGEKKTGTGTANKPSDYDKKVAEAIKLHTAGKMSDAEFQQVLTGVSQDVTPRQTAAQRRATDFTTEKAIANFYNSNPKWFKKPESIQDAHMQGLYPEFPKPYNFAQAHIAGGIADDSDYDTIKKYEAMRKYFDDNLIGRVKRSDFMNTKLPAWADRDAFLMWYTMAGEK